LPPEKQRVKISCMKGAFISEDMFDQKSFEEFVSSLPGDDLFKYELINGRIIMNPPSGWPDGEAEGDVAYLLKSHVKPRALGMVCGATQGYELPNGHTVAPDASVILKGRLEQGPKPVMGKFLRIVPNLAVEVISPSSENRDRVTKKEIYAEAGVDEYWIVDYRMRTVSVFHLLPGGVYDSGEVFRSSEKIRSHILPDLDARVDECFPVLPG
jgi:Uma2 family endonuclease